MNKSQLVEAVAEHLKMPKDEVDAILTTAIEIVEVSLACGEGVTIQKFGRFEPRIKKEVTRIHPKTGQPIAVPEKTSVLFHASPKLKERINRKVR